MINSFQNIRLNNQIIGNSGNRIYLDSSGMAFTGETINYTNLISGELSNRLYISGSNLLSLISSSSAGVFNINGASGALLITGAGNVTIISGDIGLIKVSGDTGAYASFYQTSNPQSYSSSGNVQNTGINLQSSFNLISGNLIISGQTLYNIISSLSGTFNNSGNNLYSYITSLSGSEDTKISNIRTSAITGISVTGSAYTSGNGILDISGSGNIGVILNNNNNLIFNNPYSFSKSLTLEYPASGDSITLFYTDNPLKINKIYTLLSGSSTPSVTFNLRFSTGRHVSPYYSLFSSNQSTTSVTTGDLYTVFINNIISGNSYAWLDIITTGGVLNKYSQTLFYNYL